MNRRSLRALLWLCAPLLFGCAAQEEVTPPTTTLQSSPPVDTLLSRADSLASQGDYRGALDALQKINLDMAPAPLRARAISRHEDYLIAATCAAVNTAVEKGIASVAVLDFLRPDKRVCATGMALADAVVGALPGRTKARVFTRKFISGIFKEKELTESLFADPTRRKQLQIAGVDALVCGTVGGRVSVRVVHAQTGEILSACQLPYMGRFTGRPTNAATWDKLVWRVPGKAGAELAVDVWTGQKIYRIGEQLQIHFRATADSYVTLFDLQTDGTMYVLFPNRFHSDNFCKGGVRYSVPAAGDRFAIDISPPKGVEGIKAVATKRRVDFGFDFGGGAFRKIKPRDQGAFLRDLNAKLANLAEGDWAEGKWTFRIE